jgi:hypothetical protein
MIEEKPKIDPIPAPETGLDDIAALLAEQLSASHAAAARCFALAEDEEYASFDARNQAQKTATRLMQASAAAAHAINRIKGGEFHHRVAVSRIDAKAESAARQARRQKAKSVKDDAYASIERKYERMFNMTFTDGGAACPDIDTASPAGIEQQSQGLEP